MKKGRLPEQCKVRFAACPVYFMRKYKYFIARYKQGKNIVIKHKVIWSGEVEKNHSKLLKRT